MDARFTNKIVLAAAVVAVPVGAVFAGFDAGAELRVRYEFKDNWPDKGKASVSPAYEDYSRVRVRAWAGYEAEDGASVFTRVSDEFRDYRNNPAARHKNEFPDELFVDNLYFSTPGDGWLPAFKVGRQDLKFGAGRVVSDGTPGDGSRSVFFDAVRATVEFAPKNTLDLVATWNHYRNPLAAGNPTEDYDMTKIKSGDPYSKMDEQGVMAYVTLGENKDCPSEFYWIWKNEDDFYDKQAKRPGRDFHTVGFRVSPRFGAEWSAEVEGAAQFGRVDSASGADGAGGRDIAAFMAYGRVAYERRDVFLRPSVSAAVLYLSGDDESWNSAEGGGADSGWNPVFNRTSWLGEIPAGMYDGYRWSNLVWPHVELSAGHAKYGKARAAFGPMFAAEKDGGAAGRERGFFAQASYSVALPAELNFAVVGEALAFGDYYNDGTPEARTATFLRFELSRKF